MKNLIAVIITVLLAYYFWPAETPQPTEVVEEYEDDENSEETEPSPPPKKTKVVTQPKPAVPKLQKQPRVKAKTIATQQQQKPAAEWFKSKEPPKDVIFKVDKKGNAIAFGDIYLGKVKQGGKGFLKTKVKPVQLWDSTEIPFHIDGSIPTYQKELIKETLDYFSYHTNLNFIANDGSYEDSIVFIKGDEHCYSYLGKVGGHQPIYLSGNCRENEIAHEVMHAIGFIHEHTRTDRDQYVTINWSNIQKGFENQFALVPKEYMINTLEGFPFSYNTRMLYDPKSFAKDRSKDTITSKTGKKMLPVGTILSPDDIQRINNTY